MAKGSKKPPVARGARLAKGRRRRQPARQEGTLNIMGRLLTRRVSISVSGKPKQVSAVEAIVLQLMQKAMSGNARAGRALLKYQAFSNSRSAGSLEVRFVDNDYTWAVAKVSSAWNHG